MKTRTSTQVLYWSFTGGSPARDRGCPPVCLQSGIKAAFLGKFTSNRFIDTLSSAALERFHANCTTAFAFLPVLGPDLVPVPAGPGGRPEPDQGRGLRY